VSITTSYTKPALIGGAVMGALSGLPIISIGNACCCMWVIAGGVVAAYLLQEQEPQAITAGDGATVGLFAGLFGACVSLLISIPMRLLLAPLQRQFFEQLSQNRDLPPQLRDFLTSSSFGVVGVVISFVTMLCAGAIFATLGGLLGAAIFKKKTPPGVIDIPSHPTP
jgi:hypothetical protein